MSNDAQNIAPSYQRLLKLILVLMLLGMLGELLLLGHYEDQWQMVPIGLISLSMVAFLGKRLAGTIFQKTFRVLMILCVLSGALGVWFHLKANMEFELELHPSRTGWSLLTESLSGAIPALAPGSMIPLGLIGYLFTLKNTKQ